jgi:signal transduction histidine kinase
VLICLNATAGWAGAAAARAFYDDAMSRAGIRIAVTAACGLALTIGVALLPSVYFTYRAAVARAVLETAVTLVGTLIALLCVGRFRRHRRLGDLAIALAAALLALSSPVLAVLPRAVLGNLGERTGEWAPLVVRILTATLLAAATSSVLARRALSRGSLSQWALIGGLVAVAVGATALFVWVAPNEARLLRPELSERPEPFADPLVAGIELTAGLLFAGAAVRFSMATRSPPDHFLEWLGTGCALFAVASLDYALFPSLNPSWLYVGDGLRAAGFAAWGVGAVEEIVSYWSDIARLARVEERRRLARDLHDGLAQELAFLASHAQASATARGRPDWLVQLTAGAERALAESRRAIAALVADVSPPLEADLGRTATEIARRSGALVDLDVAPSTLDAHQQETLVRIVREAVTNAIRHGRAGHISVQFREGAHPLLRVHDDGTGFDVATVAVATVAAATAGTAGSTGFGLVSMRERAATLGASLAVRSSPGEGTTVEVVWN